MLRCFQSWNLADVDLVILHCWAVLNLMTLLRHALCYYAAEMFAILKHGRRFPCATTRLSYNLSYYNVEILSILKHCCRFSRNVVGSRSESSIRTSTSPKSYRLVWRFPCLMIGYSYSTALSASGCRITRS